MIKNQDRSKWFGASDTAIMLGRIETATFSQFWGVKLGLIVGGYNNKAMQLGNLLEHAIIDKIAEITGQAIRKGKFPSYRRHRLRVNYDGLTRDAVIEVKTSEKGFDKVPKNYWMQCQVLMYAKHRKQCELWLYRVTNDDYRNPYFAEIATERLAKFEIPYDAEWIANTYLPRLRYLSRCLRRWEYPHA